MSDWDVVNETAAPPAQKGDGWGVVKEVPAGPGTTAGGVAGSVTRGLAPYAAGAGVGGLIGGPPGAAVGAGAVGLTQLSLSLYNSVAPKLGLPAAVTPQEATDKLLDLLGVKKPSTGVERTAEATVGGAASALTGAGAAGEVAKGLTGTGKAVAERLAEAPVSQAVSGGTGSAAGQAAAEQKNVTSSLIPKSLRDVVSTPLGQTVTSMVGSVVPTGAGHALGAVIAPKISKTAQELLDAGVELTPGQLGGATTKQAEEAFKSIPITGTQVRNAETRAVDSFNLATANKALEPIGVTIPKGTTGRDIIAAGQKELSDAYNALLPHMVFRVDPQFHTDLTRLSNMVRTLPNDRQTQFANVLNELMQRMQPTGSMLGDNLKIAQSELTQMAKEHLRSPMAGERQIGRAVEALGDAVHDALRRQNPTQAARLDDIDRAYAMFVRVERAANQSAVSDGRFTPGALLQAAKAEEPSIRKRGFARGDALLQDWAQKAYDVMGNKLPDSGTTGRAAWDLLGAGGAILNPKVAAGIAGTALPYAGPMPAILRGYAQPGPLRSAVGDYIKAPISSFPLLTPSQQLLTPP